MRSQWGAIAKPYAKVLDLQHPQVPPLGHDPSNRKKKSVQYIFFYLWNTHKVWYKNLWKWHGNWNYMIFDLLTSPQGHQLTLGWKFYLHSDLLVIPSIWYATWPCLKKYFFDPLGTPSPPKSDPMDHDPGDRMKIPSDMFCILHLWEHTQSLVLKIFEIDMVTEI